IVVMDSFFIVSTSFYNAPIKSVLFMVDTSFCYFYAYYTQYFTVRQGIGRKPRTKRAGFACPFGLLLI
ncbi:MAG: hypothetical protein ABS876_04510, partial [Ruminococcus sp.]